MEQLIEALQIFLKYDNPTWPTHCEHEILYIIGDYSAMSTEDKAKLEELGFHWDAAMDGWASFKYGSA